MLDTEEYNILVMATLQKLAGAVIVISRLGHTENGTTGSE